MRNLIAVDNISELRYIESCNPSLRNAPLILLSSNFSYQSLVEFKKRQFYWYDETITASDATRMDKDIHQILWKWFEDDDGRDLSNIDGSSLGIIFAPSVEFILNTILRYQQGLGSLLSSDDVVYYCSRTEDIFIDVLHSLQKKMHFKCVEVEYNQGQKYATLEGGTQTYDPNGRKRDLFPLFKLASLVKRVIFRLLVTFQVVDDNNRVLLLPAGKLDEYINDVKTNNNVKGFAWIFPLSGFADIKKFFSRSMLSYYFCNIGISNSRDVDIVKLKLKENLKNFNDIIDSSMMIDVFSRHIFSYFEGALGYYHSARITMTSLKPSLVVVSDDGYENFIIAAQAAIRHGIPVAMIPHGIYTWGYKELRYGKYKLFDYLFSFGKVDADNFILSGAPVNNVKITSFPYFERFLPIVKGGKASSYKKVLILSPDFLNFFPGEKISEEYRFYEQICLFFKKLNIEIVGIKSRHHFNFQNLGIDGNVLDIGDCSMNLLSGYKDFPSHLDGVDFVVGPASTALIEAGLLGKDYYVYQHTFFQKISTSMGDALFDVVNASFSIEQLEKNIISRCPYKSGKSVRDIIDLSGVNIKEDLYSKFETNITTVL
jgi:hypothetical protein